MNIYGVLQQMGISIEGGGVRIPTLQQNIGRGKTFYLDAGDGSTTGNGRSPSTALSTLPLAYAKLTTGINDKINLLAGDTSVNLAAAFDWALNCSHLVGEGAFGRYNQRARLGHSANFSPMLTVSGYGNSFQNLYFAHGRGNAGNLVLLDITGPRNTFLNCHFGGPFHATEAGTAGYRLVRLSHSETFFKGCIFGGGTIAATAALSFVEFGAQADPPRARFEDCTFINLVSAAGGAGSTFMKVDAGCGAGLAEFSNCKFINIGGTAMTLGIDGTGLGNFKMVFDSDCGFLGVTNVCTAGTKASAVFQTAAGLYTAPA